MLKKFGWFLLIVAILTGVYFCVTGIQVTFGYSTTGQLLMAHVFSPALSIIKSNCVAALIIGTIIFLIFCFVLFSWFVKKTEEQGMEELLRRLGALIDKALAKAIAAARTPAPAAAAEPVPGEKPAAAVAAPTEAPKAPAAEPAPAPAAKPSWRKRLWEKFLRKLRAMIDAALLAAIDAAIKPTPEPAATPAPATAAQGSCFIKWGLIIILGLLGLIVGTYYYLQYRTALQDNSNLTALVNAKECKQVCSADGCKLVCSNDAESNPAPQVTNIPAPEKPAPASSQTVKEEKPPEAPKNFSVKEKDGKIFLGWREEDAGADYFVVLRDNQVIEPETKGNSYIDDAELENNLFYCYSVIAHKGKLDSKPALGKCLRFKKNTEPPSAGSKEPSVKKSAPQSQEETFDIGEGSKSEPQKQQDQGNSAAFDIGGDTGSGNFELK